MQTRTLVPSGPPQWTTSIKESMMHIAFSTSDQQPETTSDTTIIIGPFFRQSIVLRLPGLLVWSRRGLSRSKKRPLSKTGATNVLSVLK